MTGHDIEYNKRLTREFIDAIASGDTAAIVAAYADDGRVVTMGDTLISGVYTKPQIAAVAGAILQAFPGRLQFTIHSMTAEADRVAVEAESSGVHASGKPYNNHYHFLFTVRDGKITGVKEYLDTMHTQAVICTP
jgi:ketosteroid isomerase-like protein